MPINFYSVQNHLESEGWHLLSTEYKNLDSELEMECPKGHRQTQTYKHWRKYVTCEKCMAGDPFKGNRVRPPEKTPNTTRILALDAATNTTGYAIYDDKQLVYYGVYKTNSMLETTARINQVKQWLITLIDEIEPDFVGIENVQLQNFGNSTSFQVELYRVLCNLQGVLVDTLYEKAIDHDLAYATEWRSYCGINEGKGRENKKKAAQDKVHLWYGLDCTQDEADAICIGKYFCSKIKANANGWGEKT